MIAYEVYGITDCPACLRACALLMEKDIQYVFMESDFSPAYRTALKKQWAWNTFPIIVEISISDDYNLSSNLVGGYEELVKLLSPEKASSDCVL